MDITLADVLIFEPRLTPIAVAGAAERVRHDPAEVYVSWAVSARTTPPHLPALRGGELLLLPARVAAELGQSVAALVREARSRQVSGLVVEQGMAPAIYELFEAEAMPWLAWRGDLSVDDETQINRRLTECRGELYRVGSELERQLADLAVGQAGVSALVQAAAQATALPISVRNAQGKQLAASGSDGHVGADADESGGVFLRREIGAHGTLVLGPLWPEQGVTARFLAQRLAQAVDAALRRDDAAKPRGLRRIEATEALLAGQRASASEQRAAALALGLDPDAVFLVAVSHGGSDVMVARALAPLGEVHPAGVANSRRTMLIATSGRPGSAGLAERVSEIKRQWELAHADDGATLAFSAPAFGVASLPAAKREADFVSALQAQSAFQKRAASFASVDDVGALRLLYHLRDTTELRSFVSEALGTLASRDQRGTLRATLRAFLESGGSQVDASHRLGIHRNTLAYRLRRIGELVGRDIADPTSWLTLHLALRAAEVLDANTSDG